MNHYEPQTTTDKDQYGFAPHTDVGFLTLLAQDDVGGLEVRIKDVGWVFIPPVPDALILNAGVVMSMFTRNHFRAVPHLVRNLTNRHRYSVPFFFDPNMNAIVKPIGKYKTDDQDYEILYKEHIMDNIQGNYGVGKRS